MEKKIIKIKDDHITLGKILKMLGVIDTGGQAKLYLQEHPVYVNGQLEARRGKKLYPNDKINIEGFPDIEVLRENE